MQRDFTDTAGVQWRVFQVDDAERRRTSGAFTKADLLRLPTTASDEELRQVFSNLAEPMLELSKCPDFVVNRGHYFGTGLADEAALSDDDKRALIEFIKTF